MTTNDLFVQAARRKLRFSSGKGQLVSEDLFDLSLNALDNIAVSLDDEVQKAGRKSFVAKRAASTTEADLKLEIVKFVIETKQTEAEAQKARTEKAAQKSFLLNLREKKQLEQLSNLPLEEIDKQIEALG